jgi:2-C-methyl-D-erythritol 4-phosphate cytidylyltransferase
MLQENRVAALILMGGSGERFGSDVPKQFHPLMGLPLYLHTLDVFLSCPLVDSIALVCHPDFLKEIRAQVPSNIQLIAGGPTRQSSSYLGLKHLTPRPDLVLIHDAVRPFVSHKILRDNIEAALIYGAVDTCIPSADTLVLAPSGHKIASIPTRSHYLRGQTPQTFRYEQILAAHEFALKQGRENASDDCSIAIEAGFDVFVVPGSEQNLKITSSFDLVVGECLLESGVAKR